MLQGLAIGGEYGGAAIYVAEHAPPGKSGLYTSFIQTTATLGLFVSLGVILVVRLSMSEDDFRTWGWRIPFLLSIVLVGMSYYIRVRLKESPLFTRLKEAGKTSKAPLKDSFAKWPNLKLVLLALVVGLPGWRLLTFRALHFACAEDFAAPGLLKSHPRYAEWVRIAGTAPRIASLSSTRRSE